MRLRLLGGSPERLRPGGDRGGEEDDVLCVAASAPGVEKRNDNVVTNVPMPRALPTADARADTGRAAIRTAVAISIVPISADAPWSLRTP